MYQSFIEQSPKVVEAAAMPLSQIDKLVMIGGGGGGANGNGNGRHGGGALGRCAGELPLIVERMTESVAAVTGIALKQLAGDKFGATIGAGATPRAVIDPAGQAQANGATPGGPAGGTAPDPVASSD